MRYVTLYICGVLAVLLTACGNQPSTSSLPQPAAPTSAPTQPPEPSAAPSAMPAAQPTPSSTPSPAPSATPAAQPSPSSTPAATPATKPQPETSGQVDAGKDVLLIFRKTGGIAGIDEMMIIHASGQVELSDRRQSNSVQLEQSSIAKVQTLVSSPEFAKLDARYASMGADLFIYTITLPNASAPQTVVTMDGAQNPPILSQVLEELTKLQRQAKLAS